MKHIKSAILMTLSFVVLAGFAWPALLWGIGQAAFKDKADGSLVTDAKGAVVGSSLIAQSFSKPEYFHPRPSAAGNGYDASNSSGTNLGPTSDKLINGIHKKLPNGQDDPSNFDGVNDLVAAYRKENGLSANVQVPADAVTRSASGLDPHISPANAEIQAKRVAAARHLDLATVDGLIKQSTESPFLGIFGDSAVNVLKLNLDLDKEKQAR